MNSNIKIFLLCPIPEDQKPINIYIGLKENSLTNWTTLSNINYEKKLKSLFLYCFGSVSLVQCFSWKDINYLVEWLLINLNATFTLLMFLLIVIYARWKQLEIDFNAPRLFYEEASWYDGQVWEKPLSILKNDRLISSQQIRPILQRIVRSLFTLGSWNLVCLLLLLIE